MLPLWEMMLKAGQGPDALARQFDLSRAQATAAIAALLPAFSEALRRASSDPSGLGTFFQMMTGSQTAPTFADTLRAFGVSAQQAGNPTIDPFFGSSELSRAIADQAARLTGLSSETLRIMLPAIATMMMGGVAGMAQNGFGASSEGRARNPLQDYFETVARQSRSAMGSAAAAPSPVWAENWNKALQAMFGQNTMPGSEAKDPPTGDPWTRMMKQWAALVGQESGASNKAEKPMASYEELFSQLFNQKHEAYERRMASIFDQFWSKNGQAPR